MNLKEVLQKKAEYPVRMIANESSPNFNKGDEIGIEVVDFSIGNLRCVNKTQSKIFEIFYDKKTWELDGKWSFKNI